MRTVSRRLRVTEASVVDVPIKVMSNRLVFMNGQVAHIAVGHPVVTSVTHAAHVVLLPPVQYCCNGTHLCTGVTLKLLMVRVLLSVMACQLVPPCRY